MQYDYQITWIGASNQTLSLGGLSFLSSKPKYFTKGNLPLQLNEIKNLPGVSIVVGEFIDPVDAGETSPSTVANRIEGATGIVWRGNSSVKTIMVGKKRVSLEKGVANFDFNSSEVDFIVKNYSSVEKV